MNLRLIFTVFLAGDFEDPLAKYENVDVSKYALDLDIYQVAYLHRLLPENKYRFLPEETAKKKIQSVIRNLNKKKNAKSALTDSVISNSEMLSSSERNVQDSNSIQSKKLPPTPPQIATPVVTSPPVQNPLKTPPQESQKTVAPLNTAPEPVPESSIISNFTL